MRVENRNSAQTLKYGRHEELGRSLRRGLEAAEPSQRKRPLRLIILLMKKILKEKAAKERERKKRFHSRSTKKCSVKPSTVKLKDLTTFERLDIEFDLKPLTLPQLEPYMDEPGTKPEDGRWHKFCLEERDDREYDVNNYKFDPESLRLNVWTGQSGPGVLVIEEIKRKTGPYSSQISQAVYENDFDPSTLNYIYFVDVQNEDTLDFVTDQLYTPSNGVVEQDDEITERYEWEYGSPEFDGLLGTKFGNHVVYLIMGAFKRGTRRIQRVRTWFAFQELQMQFILENIGDHSTDQAEPVKHLATVSKSSSQSDHLTKETHHTKESGGIKRPKRKFSESAAGDKETPRPKKLRRHSC
ncbi:unnamed protein product [Penicillium salamii]|uniref:Uncharacterized protein n=1 Tax=Penicillium salamii TaxID=1612424 RepID=A0A9W4JXE8_9EURO|nr:unnamed protein product [Penicillium salamii]CAG8027160.1 unnamed protein product [Penicillium salamii]CAG8062108.1 unnamed protein product [Penicillium salamii]CAG8080895.1 unnamed protein product [Penicillium salamii]CAG8186671.1 unnamed protein product [Penicillium salamii]